MIINLDERRGDGEVLIFLKSESVEEAAQILRITSRMKECNQGWVNYSENSITGWIAIPLAMSKKTYIQSGTTHR